MNPLAGAFIRFNHARLWHRHVRIGPDRLFAPSLDRLVYLWRHKFFAAGSAEAKFLQDCVRPGMHVIDAGANVGAYAHLFARAVGPTGRVTAFEPDPVLFAALEASARANGLTQLHPERIALGSEPGRGRLNQGLFNSGDNRLAASPGHATAGSVDTPIVTLDKFVNGRPVDFIKMDIQGWEMNALRGMTRTLDANPRLQLYIELWPHGLQAAGSSPPELFALLAAHGFICEIRPGNPAPASVDFAALAAGLSGPVVVLCPLVPAPAAARPGGPRGNSWPAGRRDGRKCSHRLRSFLEQSPRPLGDRILSVL